ncbi:ATP-binding protein [Microbulbifer thermotolerans]|uniref:ATP-binding protein n=1 Tax=Microbulbifer thermotolerans TaxID=252514 RepID=UPI00224A5F4B|nr:ATP-binding protein [Microbulbifer thermotolerans]MCX2834698.1 ATP-binding protein [Microbulbifer thermotolerans]MCX2841187.1 ATP-binding protein [Microbulbifer thermotolerans]WKT61737.1 ATP-binding protein [Microbulbifer thermotolerans]
MLSFWFDSLKGRLSLVTSLMLVAFLLVFSGVLEHAYRSSLDEAKERELQLHVYTLLAVAEPEAGTLSFPPLLPEQRFNQPDSGLVGAVTDDRGRVIWRSASSLALPQLPSHPLPQGRQAFGQVTLPGDAGRYVSFRQGVAWGLDNEQRFTFIVMEDAAPLAAQVEQFRSTLWRWLGLGALLLVLIQWLVLRWGLAPLRSVTRGLQEMQRGGSDRLEGKFPGELRPLTDNLNLLIENERRQREKTRHTLADLAHSLKTPLAVLKGLNFSGDPREAYKTLIDQVQRMDSIIGYQLNRAVTGSPKSILRGVPVAPLVQKILDALEKVYRENPCNVQLKCDQQTRFYGDEGDLMELLGNLLDNGYKYGGGEMDVAIEGRNDGRKLHIRVADRGPGMDEEKWQQVTQRGVRADQQQPGQGIGLAVVVDIVESYEGQISAVPRPGGGTEIKVDL